MEASTSKNKSFARPMTISEMLPGLSGLLSDDAMRTLTAKKKKPRPTIAAQARTTEKVLKPMTIAEMRTNIQALRPLSPRKYTKAYSTTKKNVWNSSVKVDFKKVSHTDNGQLKDNPVRKVLNFQKAPSCPRKTMVNAETPKFPKPELRAKNSKQLQARNLVNISGICDIPQTPMETIKKPTMSRMTIGNKENYSHQANIIKKQDIQINVPTPKRPNHRLVIPKPIPMNSLLTSGPTPKTTNRRLQVLKAVADTTLTNFTNDDSFLEREKEIRDVEDKEEKNITTEEKTLENIADISPPVSTPFKDYRSMREYFNNSSVMENSDLCNDNTIMCFDKPSVCNENDKREESVIVSLCDLFNKATVTNAETKESTELDDLLEVKKQTEKNIKMIDCGIEILNSIKESQIKSLKNVNRLIEEKRSSEIPESDIDKTLVEATHYSPKSVEKCMLSTEKSPIISTPCSVIKSSINTPCYKVPKRNSGSRKKVICKSMPNVSSGLDTPVKDIEGPALNIYMQMKQRLNFLSTPMVNRVQDVPDTPAVTSHNLQKQLDKLYNGS